MRIVPCLALLAATAAVPARADPLVLFSGAETADSTIAAPQGVTAALAGGNPLVGGLQSGAVQVVAPDHGALTIAVDDVGEVGDVFEVLLDGVSLGTTSHVAVGGPDNSAGTFVASVAAGPHAIDLWDYVQPYVGLDSPYGGAVTQDFSLSDVQLDVSLIPEPGGLFAAALGALGLGALGLGAARRRRAG